MSFRALPRRGSRARLCRIGIGVGLFGACICILLGAATAPALAQSDGETNRTTVDGVAFTPPDIAKNAEQFRDALNEAGYDVPDYVLLVTNYETEEAYIVFTDIEPQTGVATVTGRDVTTDAADLNGSSTETSVRIIIADRVDITTGGPYVPYKDLERNTGAYTGQVVETSASYGQIAMLGDGPEGLARVQFARGQFDPAFGDRPPTFASVEDVFALSEAGIDGTNAFTLLVNEYDHSNAVFGLQSNVFYQRGPANVTVVPTRPGSPAIYYLVDVEPTGAQTSAEAIADGDHEAGDHVEFTAPAAGGRLSVRKTLLQAARCAPRSVANPATGCLPLVTDNVVWAGAAGSADQPVPIIGISNHPQDVPLRPFSGRYTIVGEVVAADNLEAEVPGQYAIRISALEREGDADISGAIEAAGDGIADSAQREVESYAGEDGRNISETPTNRVGDGGGSQSGGSGEEGDGEGDGEGGGGDGEATVTSDGVNGTEDESGSGAVGGGGSSGGSVADGGLPLTLPSVALLLGLLGWRRRISR